MTTTVMVIALLALAPVTALGVYDLQRRLESWDYRKHAQD